MALEIQNLHVEVEGTQILNGINLVFEPDSIHVIMGPNGSGKSTLANALMGHPKYKITQGKIILDGKDITHEPVNIRAKAGLFLSFQYPQEVQGVTISNFLRTAVNAKRDEGNKLSVIDFHKILKEKMALLKMDPAFSRRALNHGFSGGEKKRNEMLQLMLLEPKYALLDETDSGLDVDAIKTVAENIITAREHTQMGVVVITHYNRFLQYLKPHKVSILYKGNIIKQGGFELAQQIEKEGFEKIIN